MIVCDTETTGLINPKVSNLNRQPFITEFCGIKLDDNFNIIGEYNQLIKPPIPISEKITEMTGITNEMVAGQPSFAQCYQNLCLFFLGESLVIGHNISFDMQMLWLDLARIDKQMKFPYPPEWHCTIQLSMPIQHRRLNLGSLYKIATGKDHTNAHRARGDVLATIECYRYLKSSGFIG